MILVSTLALRGTGRVEEAVERVGLTLDDRPLFTSFFTSSSSVPVTAQCKRVELLLHLVSYDGRKAFAVRPFTMKTI